LTHNPYSNSYLKQRLQEQFAKLGKYFIYTLFSKINFYHFPEFPGKIFKLFWKYRDILSISKGFCEVYPGLSIFIKTYILDLAKKVPFFQNFIFRPQPLCFNKSKPFINSTFFLQLPFNLNIRIKKTTYFKFLSINMIFWNLMVIHENISNSHKHFWCFKA